MKPISRTLSRRAGFGSLACALALCMGCFGAFPMTKGLYKFNVDSSENEFVQSVMFWVTSPGYLFCVIADIIVLNPIEFWGGNAVELSAGPNTDVKVSSNASPEVYLTRTGTEEFTMLNARTGMIEGYIRKAENGDVLVCSATGGSVRRLPGKPRI